MKYHLLCSLTLALNACGNATNPPSLMPRAIEKRSDAVVVKPIPATRPIAADLTTQLATLVEEARRGDEDFAKADATGARAIAGGRGAAQGSEAWLSGQQYLSALQVARQRTAAAQSALDSLAVAQVAATADDPGLGGLAEIQHAQQGVDAIVARQTARIEALTR